jgi:Double zinc ribbon
MSPPGLPGMCPQCQQENPSHARSCLGYGSRLVASCARCDAELASGARFCPHCGHEVASRSTVEARFASPGAYTPKHLAEKILTSKVALEGERKQVTVLFCDVANSTATVERLGPEAMHRLLSRLFELALVEILCYEGTINQFLGLGRHPKPASRRHLKTGCAYGSYAERPIRGGDVTSAPPLQGRRHATHRS